MIGMLFVGLACSGAAPSRQLLSPDGRIKLEVTLTDTIRLSVSYGEETLVTASPVFLNVGGKTLGSTPKLVKE